MFRGVAVERNNGKKLNCEGRCFAQCGKNWNFTLAIYKQKFQNKKPVNASCYISNSGNIFPSES